MPVETRPVTYDRSRAGVPETSLELVDVTCEPDPRQGPRHRLLVPAGWYPVPDLPVDPDPEALRICSLFLEAPDLGERGAVLMVSSQTLEDPEASIHRLAASEGLEVAEIYQEREGDLRALCTSARRESLMRVLHTEEGWLILTATVPADRVAEVEEAFHFCLISLEVVPSSEKPLPH
jgi:hypothetical protein